MPIDIELLKILACPQCKGSIDLSKEQNGLICKNCKLLYPIKNNIPHLLVDEAIKIQNAEGGS